MGVVVVGGGGVPRFLERVSSDPKTSDVTETEDTLFTCFLSVELRRGLGMPVEDMLLLPAEGTTKMSCKKEAVF
jgi:hypothetical protein